jgi:hypothetical protein
LLKQVKNMPVRAYKLAPPFTLMLFRQDSLERNAAMRGAFPFLANKHALGLSFELRDHQLPTSSDLTPELQQCLGSALDKILHMCDGFPAESDEVFILRNFAIILPQLLFVYGTRTEQVRRADDLFNQGKWEDLWKLANKAGERANARAAKNPRRSKPKSDAQKDAYSQNCARAGNLSKAAATLYKILPPACNSETVDRLRLLHPEGDFWESEIGTNLLSDVFSVRNVGAYFSSASPLGAPDPDG